jgi:hypothetical protein
MLAPGVHHSRLDISMRNVRRLGRAAVLAALAAFAAGCDIDSVGPGIDGPPEEGPSRDDTGIAPATRRIGLDVRATGAFRPGAPIVVSSTARGVKSARGVDWELIVLDEEGDNAEVRRVGRSVAQFRGDLSRGAQRQLTATLTFPRAGYYRVLSIARGEGPANEVRTAGDSAIIDLSSETLYLYVDEQGGRITNGFDPAVESPGRSPQFGAFGPFVSRQPAAQSAARVSASAARVYDTRTFVYYDENIRGNRAVNNGEITIECLDYSFNVIRTYPTRTGTDGTFVINCETPYYNGIARLRNIYADVYGRDRQDVSAFFGEYDGAGQIVSAPNHYAGHVFHLLTRYVPIAEQRFGHRRAAMTVYVADDTTYAINYNQTQDIIRQNRTRVFGEDGTFVTIHEYGHAFQWRAIEAPASYYCSPTGEHRWTVAYTLSCGWVEGFASFFATWVAGDALRNTYYSDHTVETQINPGTSTRYWQYGSGVLIEPAVAGFFYDLVDGTASPDGPANETGTDDDAATYPADFLATVMRTCTLTSGTTTISALDGIDQFIYCLEGNTTAYSLGYANWRSYGSVNRGTTTLPTGYSTTTVRAIWRRNLYGV